MLGKKCQKTSRYRGPESKWGPIWAWKTENHWAEQASEEAPAGDEDYWNLPRLTTLSVGEQEREDIVGGVARAA